MDEADQGGSNINPLAFGFLVVMCGIILGSSRRNAVRAMLAMAAFIPLGQQILILGLHFYFLRILILVGLIRVFSKNELAGFQLRLVDKLFLWWAAVGFICAVIRGPSAETFAAVYDTVGVYLLVRILIREPEDVLAHLQLLAVAGIVIGVCMTWELMTHRDPFSIFGGVSAVTVQRGDRFRCQGPFRHPILTGTFGATLFPLMVGLWFQGGRGKWLALLGGIGSIVTTIASASSGPFLTFVAAIIGFGLWPLRERMYLVRRSIVAVFIGFALVMKAPVWYLIAKVSDLFGGGGFHRSWLIDQFVNHFTQWWLVGTANTANWAQSGIVLTVDANNMDITNHYVRQGVNGGVLLLGLFIAIIVCCYKTIGRVVRFEENPAFDRRLFWGFGVCLTAHCMAFISVSYFDQIQVFWFWLLAAVTSFPVFAEAQAEEDEATEADDETEAPANLDTAALS